MAKKVTAAEKAAVEKVEPRRVATQTNSGRVIMRKVDERGNMLPPASATNPALMANDPPPETPMYGDTSGGRRVTDTV